MAAPGTLHDFEQYLRDEPAPPPHPALALPPAQLAGRIQHTLIGQAVTEHQVREHVQECLVNGFDAAIVPPSWVWAAREEMRGTAGRVGSFIDYPHGSGTTAGRVAEAKALVDAGVDDLDSTVNNG
jgi:deoxyribose-phosphate aldolase